MEKAGIGLGDLSTRSVPRGMNTGKQHLVMASKVLRPTTEQTLQISVQLNAFQWESCMRFYLMADGIRCHYIRFQAI